MPQITGQGFCEHCRSPVLTTQNAPNHLAHFLITIFLIGCWLPVWIFIALTAESPRCTRCGQSMGTYGGSFGAVLICALIGALLTVGGIYYFSTADNDRQAAAELREKLREREAIQESQERVEQEKARDWGRDQPRARPKPEPSAQPIVSVPQPRVVEPQRVSLPTATPTPTPRPVSTVPNTAFDTPVEPPKPKPWQASRKWTINGTTVEGSVKSWSPSKVVIVRPNGQEITTTRDALSEFDRSWFESKLGK